MRTDGAGVTLINILGCDYSVKTSAGQGPALLAAEQLLQRLLAETKAQSPALVRDKLLVMTALKLCAQLQEQQRDRPPGVEQMEAQLSARIDAIAQLIRPT
jgi:cell division protein ZapA